MPFAGTMGAAAAMTPIGVLSTPSGVLTYAADAISVLETEPGASTAILRESVANLIFTMAQDQGPLLDVMDAAPPTANLGSVGVLTTRAPIADTHGIPANWGAGRGNWNADNIKRVNAQILSQDFDVQAATAAGTCVVFNIGESAGDIDIEIRNMSESVLDSMVLLLEYRHSVEIG